MAVPAAFASHDRHRTRAGGRLYPDLPVVPTSSYSHVLAQNGTFGFELLHKPYSVEQLSQTLQKAAAWRRRR